MTEGPAAREHSLHADLVLAVCHVPPGRDVHAPDDTAGQITPRVSWGNWVTPTQRIHLARSARAALDLMEQQALADHEGGGR